MKKVNWKQVLILLSNIFSALFLTVLVDEITLTTSLHKIFIFLYFYFTLFVIVKVVSIYQISWQKGLIVLSAVFAISFIKISGFDNYYKCADIEISPIGKISEEANGEEVWIKDIIVDGNSIFHSYNYNFSGWYREENSGYLRSYNEEKTEPFFLSIEYINNYSIVFIKHSWSGGVEVTLNGEKEQYDLYADVGQDIEKTFGKEYAKKIISWNNILMMLGGFILFFQIIYIVLIFAVKRNIKIEAVALLCSTGIFIDGLYQFPMYIFISSLGIAASIIIKNDLCKTMYINKYKKYRIFIILVALYSSICMIARETSIYGENNNISFFYVLFLNIITISSILILLEKIKREKMKEYDIEIKSETIRKWLVLKNILLAIIFSFVIVRLIDDYVIKDYQESEVLIQALGEVGENGNGNEVLLDSIRIDGKVVPMKDYISTTGDWKPFGKNSYIYNKSTKVSDCYLKFPAERKIELYFYNSFVGGKAELIEGSNRQVIDFSTTNKNYSNNFYIYQVKSNIVDKNYTFQYFFIGFILFSVLFFIFTAYDVWIYKNDSSYKRIYARYSFWKIWIVIFSGLNIVIFAYFPGNWSWDILYQWGQATYMVSLSDSHPILLTLFLRFILQIYQHPYMFVESLIILVTTVFSGIFSYFIEKGIRKRLLYFGSILVITSPAIIIMISNPLKDSFQMCFMALMVFYLYIIVKNPEYLKRPYYYIGLCSSLFFIGQLRHEAILSTIVCSILIIVLAIKNKKYFLIGIVTISTLLSLSFDSFKASLVPKNSVDSGICTILLNDISRVLYDEKELTKESEELLELYLPLERWKELYHPFDRDTLGFDSEYRASVEKNKEITVSKVLKCYLREFIHHPLSIALSRLDAVNDIWYIGVNENSSTFYGIDGIMTFYCVGPKELGFSEDEQGVYRANNVLSGIVKPFITFMEENILFNRIFLNTGIALVGCLIVILYLYRNNRRLIILASPILVRVITMALLSGWQHFRYYYSIRLMCIVFIAIGILDSYDKEENTFSILDIK